MRYFRLLMVPALFLLCFPAQAQTVTFTRDDLDYTIQLPTTAWQAVTRLDIHRHVEFVNGHDYRNGYLRLRKKLVPMGTSALELFQYDERWELQSLPGYVACSNGNGTNLQGQLNGSAFAYEYILNGRPMDGRIYYLRANARIFYVLHFTVASEKLRELRPQMDFIASSFRIK